MLIEHDDVPVTLYEKLQAERLFLVNNMQLYGGSFVVALALAFLRADPDNYAKLKQAFPVIYEKYSNMEEDNDGKAVDES